MNTCTLLEVNCNMAIDTVIEESLELATSGEVENIWIERKTSSGLKKLLALIEFLLYFKLLQGYC